MLLHQCVRMIALAESSLGILKYSCRGGGGNGEGS